MKLFVILFFAAASVVELFAYPSHESAPAATLNDTNKALNAMNHLKGPLNPTDLLKEGATFLTTVMNACETFLKNVLKPFDPNTIPGLDNLSKLKDLSALLTGTNPMFNPKNIFPANTTDLTKNVPQNVPGKSVLSAGTSVLGGMLGSFGF